MKIYHGEWKLDVMHGIGCRYNDLGHIQFKGLYEENLFIKCYEIYDLDNIENKKIVQKNYKNTNTLYIGQLGNPI